MKWEMGMVGERKKECLNGRMVFIGGVIMYVCYGIDEFLFLLLKLCYLNS